MNLAEVADALGLKHSQAENYFKDARKRLTGMLEQLVRNHVARYSTVPDVDAEFAHEWQTLGDYLKQHGGLDQAVSSAYRRFSARQFDRVSGMMNKALANLTMETEHTSGGG
jgi:hypothetical protein